MNYKTLRFTEENLKLEGAEVWSSRTNCKAIHTLPLFYDGEYLVYWEDKTYSHYPDHEQLLEIRIPIKKLTREEAAAKAWHFSKEKYNLPVVDWNGLTVELKEQRLCAMEAYHAMKVNGEVED